MKLSSSDNHGTTKGVQKRGCNNKGALRSLLLLLVEHFQSMCSKRIGIFKKAVAVHRES